MSVRNADEGNMSMNAAYLAVAYGSLLVGQFDRLGVTGCPGADLSIS